MGELTRNRLTMFNPFRTNFSFNLKLSEKNLTKGSIGTNPAGIYVFEVNNGSTKTMCEICSKLTIKTPQRSHLLRFGVCIVNFE